jgi:hypothetical protein
VIPAFWRLRQEDPEFQVSLDYIKRSCFPKREREREREIKS